MKVLLDTHALLWWWAADRRIDPVRAIIADAENEIFVSAASIWEIATKHRIGKLPEAGRLLPDMDVRFGIRNAFNLSYSDPIALNPAVDSMPQSGRTFFLELIAHRAR